MKPFENSIGGISAEVQRLSTAEFQHLSNLVYQQCGINLSVAKKIMLESRLHKRLRVLSIATFKDYIKYISTREGIEQELVHMIDVVTTNKTDFFREPHHFDFLRQNILPQLILEKKSKVNVWSAACSSGEEPYTLAMVIEDFARIHKGFDYSIFGSDISTHVLQKALMAVYTVKQAADIPMVAKQKYMLKNRDAHNPTVRVVPELRKKVKFGRINLMDTALPIDEQFDIVFCRNVLIYFDRQTQQDVVRKLTDKLKRGGHLFIGHSESLYQLDLPITQIKPTIYIKK